MTTLDIAISCGQAPKRIASTHGGEFACGCPVCGGRDRFRLWPNKGENGAWMCRGCDKGGDAIELLKFAKGMTYKEACDYLGKEAKTFKRNRTPVPPKKQAPDFIPREISDPVELWQAKAAAFTESAHRELLQNTQQLAWLAARGITVETVKRFRLGWNPKRLWRKRAAWGVPDKTVKEKDGSEKEFTLFALHLGLVIPYVVSEKIHRLRLRRPEEGLDDRYYVVPGSGMAPMMIPPGLSLAGRGKAWAVVESELDAILIAQDAGDLTGAASLGSVSTKPDGALYDELKASDVVLCALDFDKAGAKGKAWWERQFPQADRWPVPHGKDPGDYRKDGGDVRAWILAGLPPGLRPAPVVIASEARQSQGETKQPEVETKAPQGETKEAEADHIADAGKLVEPVIASEARQSPDIAPEAELDEIAKLPEADNFGYAAPYYAATVRCVTCGKEMDYYGPIGKPPYKGPCSKCLAKLKPPVFQNFRRG